MGGAQGASEAGRVQPLIWGVGCSLSDRLSRWTPGSGLWSRHLPYSSSSGKGGQEGLCKGKPQNAVGTAFSPFSAVSPGGRHPRLAHLRAGSRVSTTCGCPVWRDEGQAHRSLLFSCKTSLISHVAPTASFCAALTGGGVSPGGLEEALLGTAGLGRPYLASDAPWCSPGWSGRPRRSRRWTSHRG